jgi:flagellar basal-body rod protein FlgB
MLQRGVLREGAPFMAINSIPLFSLLSGRMSWLSARQSVLAENVANSETPNYAVHDLKPLDFERLIGNGAPAATMVATDPRHIAPRADAQSFDEDTGLADTSGRSPVSLEQEMIKLSDTQVQYQAATNIYQKAVGMFRTALGGPNGG